MENIRISPNMIKALRMYLFIARSSFKRQMVYRGNVIVGIISSSAIMYMLYCFWHALYAHSPNMKEISLPSIITYAVLSRVISVLMTNPIELVIEGKIESGEITIDLIRPYSFYKACLFSSVGENVSLFLLKGLPLLFIGATLLGIGRPQSIHAFFLFLVAILTLVNSIFKYLEAVVSASLHEIFVLIT